MVAPGGGPDPGGLVLAHGELPVLPVMQMLVLPPGGWVIVPTSAARPAGWCRSGAAISAQEYPSCGVQLFRQGQQLGQALDVTGGDPGPVGADDAPGERGEVGVLHIVSTAPRTPRRALRRRPTRDHARRRLAVHPAHPW